MSSNSSSPPAQCGNRRKQNATSKTSGEDYLSPSVADPAFGPKTLNVNLGRAAGQDDENLYAVIWNPVD
jgi:uncharacterized protein (DUF736 family)